MRDGPARTALKLCARCAYLFNIRVVRLWARIRGRQRFLLAGSCESCARCCESPSISVGRLVWYLPLLRRGFLWWQRVVNGFVLRSKARQGFVFVFDCTHFDRETRRCDSYHSRPGMCRDYPRMLLGSSQPDFFPECGFRPLHPRAEQMLAELETQDLSSEQRRDLTRRLFLR